MSKYRDVFLEEAADHLAEMSRALLELEKDPTRMEAIDVLFRMAHSIKGMAASLEYDAITQVAHQLEDRIQEVRSAGTAVDRAGMALLFRGLDVLESMVASVRETGEAPTQAAPLTLEPAIPPAREGVQKKA